MKPVIIYPRTIDWDHLHQRPQQMLKSLAKLGYTCIFGNTNQNRKRMPGLELIDRNLYLGNEMPLDSMVQWCRKHWPQQKVIVMYSYPPQVQEVLAAGPDHILFDSLDEPEGEFSHWKDQYDGAVTTAGMVIASAKSLQERSQQLRSDKVTLISNGCDFEHFQSAMVLKEKINEPPFNWIPKGQKIVGFVGAVATWLDWDLISKAAQRMPSWHFVFIGPLYGFSHPPVVGPNIHYVGHKPYEDLPKYMAYFEVLWMPFKVNEMTKGVNPIKMWEYLATGIPILSTALPEVPTEYINVMNDDFVLVSTAKYSSSTDRRNHARWNSWDNRANMLREVLVMRGWSE